MELIVFFEEVASKIHNYEESAKKALDDGKNEVYINIMEQKAQTLAALVLEIKKYPMASLKWKAQHYCMQTIEQFSASAKNAIRLNSTWYKSQLLFDEDYQEGEPNNFDLFLEKLKELNQ